MIGSHGLSGFGVSGGSGVKVGSGVAVDVGVNVGVGVGVSVRVGVDVGVDVGTGVGVGFRQIRVQTCSLSLMACKHERPCSVASDFASSSAFFESGQLPRLTSAPPLSNKTLARISMALVLIRGPHVFFAIRAWYSAPSSLPSGFGSFSAAIRRSLALSIYFSHVGQIWARNSGN